MKHNESEKFLKQVNHAINKCYWRKEVYGVNICTGMANPCARVIDRGECDTLKKLYAKEGEDNGRKSSISEEN